MGAERPTTQDLEGAVRTLLSGFDDPSREGLSDTPKRVVKFWRQFIQEGKDFEMTTFDGEGMDEMIVVKDIEFYSVCEHHMAPFFGKAHIAYIPKGKIVGLSKIPRALDKFARNFQNQERITTQVAEYLQLHLDPVGVAVVLEAKHLCVCMRGIKKQDAMTVTSKMLGVFKEDHMARAEFMAFIGRK